ncbi:hypothetical protein RE943_40660 [Prescottella equi]|uniref:hypothetical protein n=1 Tax=Rhodococcus hoagii TaxID=43767 RepID=UPI001C772A6E|nr:hypothetical protein [Prescottella equi]BCN70593.1 hypothetical protein RE943_40660 [Prescottella equi]
MTRTVQAYAAPDVSPDRSWALRPADIVQLALFTTYAVAYGLYSAGKLGYRIYFAAMVFFVLFAGGRLLWIRLISRRREPLVFGRSAAAVLGAAAVLVAMSFAQQLMSVGYFDYTSISEVLYIVVPIVIALGISNTVTLRLADIYMTIFLLRYLLYFVLSDEFSVSAIMAISWSNSTSAFESSFAHDLLVVGTYFIVRRKKFRAGLSVAFTMLALKRASFILAPLLALFGRRLSSVAPPRIRSIVALFVIGVASPFIVMAVYSPAISQALATNFGMDLDGFTSGRLSIYELAIHCSDVTDGFGSLNDCLGELAIRTYGTTWNGLLHNDTLRIYMEVGFVGVAAYLGALSYISRGSFPAFILMTYTFFVLITSRLVTHMSFWVVLFTVIALFERFYSARNGDCVEPLSGEVAEKERGRTPQ